MSLIARELAHGNHFATSILPAIYAGANPKGITPASCVKYRTLTKDLERLTDKLKSVWRTVTYIQGNLQKRDLPVDLKGGEITRIAIVKTYNSLHRTNQLSLLSQPESQLFDYQNYCHPALEKVMQEYMKLHPPLWTYSVPLRYTQCLRHSCLTHLENTILKENEQRLERLITYNTQEMEEEHATFITTEALKGMKASDFPRGDFSFIACKTNRRWVSHAFKVIELAGKWEYLKRPYVDTNTGLSDVTDRISASHSGTSMKCTMHQMHLLHTLGWEAFVSMHLPHKSRL